MSTMALLLVKCQTFFPPKFLKTVEINVTTSGSKKWINLFGSHIGIINGYVVVNLGYQFKSTKYLLDLFKFNQNYGCSKWIQKQNG